MKTQLILIFPSRLGWMAMVAAGATIRHLTFGHSTAAYAQAAASKYFADSHPDICKMRIDGTIVTASPSPSPHLNKVVSLAHRLRTYAAGARDDFRNVRVDPGPVTDFQRRVLAQCRQVRYGSTISYAELADNVGCPGAARAVGNSMAANRIPLIIPCHRVVCANGRIGSYSAPGGIQMKSRLLMLEGNNWTRIK